MNAHEVLNQLRSAGVVLEALGGELRFTAPAGAMTPEMKSRISGVKGELIELLSKPKGGTVNNPHRVWSRQTIQCFFCDKGLIRQEDLYWCQHCNCWFRDMGPEE